MPAITCSPASGSTFAAGTTTVTCTATNTCGNASCTFNVTVNTASAASTGITSSNGTNICTGSSTILTQTGGTLGTGASYKWYTGSCGGTLAGTGTTLTVNPTATTTYYVRGEGACNNTSCASVTIIVSTAPPAGGIYTPVNVPQYACNGNSFAASCNVVSNVLIYTWDGPSGTFFNGGNTNPYNTASNNVTVNFGPPSGAGYQICVQGSNACGATNRKCGFVMGTVGTPANISGSTTACVNTSGTYSIPAVAQATGYTWTTTGNMTVTGGAGTTSVTVSFGAGFTSGTLCVAAHTPCYTGGSRCMNIATLTASPGAISGPSPACPGSTQTYSVPTVSGANTYNWTLPAGATGSSTTHSINVTFLAGYIGGNISVTITSVCGSSSVAQAHYIASGTPLTPSAIVSSGGTTGLCSQTVVFTCSTVAGSSSYTWTVPSGTIINSGQGSNSINVTFPNNLSNTAQMCVTANGTCGSSLQRCLQVRGAPATPGAITLQDGPVCTGGANNFSIPSDAGTTTYTWSLAPATMGHIILASGTSCTAGNWTGASGSIVVMASNACGGSTGTLAINPVNCARIGKDVQSSTAMNLNVYPNPAHDRITVEFNATASGNYSLNIMDMTGRLISTTANTSSEGLNSQVIDVSNLAKGMYLLELRVNDSSEKLRIVVE